jgi:uncharacterized protein YhaN
LNCSITVKNKKQLDKAVERLENDQDLFEKNVLALNKFSSKYRGLDKAQTIVESLQD